MNFIKIKLLYILLNIYYAYTQAKEFAINCVKGVLWNTVTHVTAYSLNPDNPKVDVVYDITNPYHLLFYNPYNIKREGYAFDVEKGFSKHCINKDIVFFNHAQLYENEIIYATVDEDHNDISPFLNKYMTSLSGMYTQEVFYIMHLMNVIPVQIKNKINEGFVEINIMKNREEYVKTLKATDYFIV